MSPIAGLLIEYFVVGSIAALWAVPVLLESSIYADLPKETIGVAAAALAPSIYLLGMSCDWVGALLSKPFKHRIEAGVWKNVGQPERSSQVIHAYAVAYKPELAHEIDARSSRDRIARGSFVASLPLLYFSPFGPVLSFPSVLPTAFVICAIAALWFRTQKLSSQYEAAVVSVLEAKECIEIPSKGSKVGDQRRAGRMNHSPHSQ